MKKPSPSEGTVQYQFSDALAATQFVDVLRDHGVEGYDMVGPTLEDVFLANAEEVKEYDLLDAGEDERSGIQTSHKEAGELSERQAETQTKLEMGKGHGTSMIKQTFILMQKRWTILRRNFWPYVFSYCCFLSRLQDWSLFS